MRLIALTGQINVGKSTVAAMLKDFGYEELTFAEPLKQIAMIMGFEHKEVFGNQDDKLKVNEFWQVSGRTFLEKFGTEVCRVALPNQLPTMSNLWVRLMEKKVKTDKKVVISDCRFANEVKMIQENNGFIIKITRKQDPIYNSKHISNTEELPFDVVLENNGTLDDLKKNLIKLLKLDFDK